MNSMPDGCNMSKQFSIYLQGKKYQDCLTTFQNNNLLHVPLFYTGFLIE